MTNFYPLVFEPVYKDYIWGGRKLEKFGRDLPGPHKLAESWEIAAHQDGMTLVANGDCKGRSLQVLVDEFGVCLVGTKNRWALDRGKFPLLVKLIDANQALSVQVHPDDAYAGSHEKDELGKSEMWIVLAAEPGAEIIYGLSEKLTPDELRETIERGSLEQYLNKVPIQAGDHVCVPAGTLHAILSGAVLVEIQQNSNTTYRVYDWNRVGKDGQPRQLQIEKALDVINYEQVGHKLTSPELIQKVEMRTSERLCQNPYFTVERHYIKQGGRYVGDCDGSTMEIWGVLSGEVDVNGLASTGVGFVLLPAALGPFDIKAKADSVLLRAFAT
jgi:mannose-6-phosphate isomerase